MEITTLDPRPPVVVVMGHIDHGKSTLLDYIRKTNVVDKEVGGITQRMSSYEVVHKAMDANGKEDEKTIVFIDTPGHESFSAIRARGATAADIAILVVSAEDGVKPQTLDALQAIKNAGLSFIVGISKIDKPNADIDRVKLSLAENEIYVEGYGGNIPWIAFSGKTGEGVNDLLDLILLTAEVDGISGDPFTEAECVVIEANRDKIRGISATLIVKNGTLYNGSFIVSGTALSPVRIMENFLGKPLKEAGPSKPVRVIGWTDEPEVGGVCFTFGSKKAAEAYIEEEMEKVKERTEAIKKVRATERVAATNKANALAFENGEEVIEKAIVPVIIKADTSGSAAAVVYEIENKIKVDNVEIKIVAISIGDILENDIKLASGKEGTVILGFNTKIDSSAKSLAERNGINIMTFDIIYKMTEWLQEFAEENRPRTQVEESKGIVKVLRIFSVNKEKQVIGGRVESGSISLNDEVKILRRDIEIGRGRVRELQQQKAKTSTVEEGKEFGTMIESKIEIAAGDKLEPFQRIVK
jgi:translation initiation factor IF-2